MIGEVHRSAAILARATLMEAGKHAICERPLGIGLDDAQRAVRVAETTGMVNTKSDSHAAIDAPDGLSAIADGLRAAQICDAMLRSAESRQWEQVED